MGDLPRVCRIDGDDNGAANIPSSDTVTIHCSEQARGLYFLCFITLIDWQDYQHWGIIPNPWTVIRQGFLAKVSFSF